MPLRHLTVNMSDPLRTVGISTLEPLDGMELARLEFMNNRVSSLALLDDMPLDTLNCQGNPLRSLNPMVDSPPTEFFFYSETLPLWELRRVIRAWQKDTATAHLAHRARVYLALRRENWNDLRREVWKRGSHEYLYVALHVPLAEARAIARKAGGHLATLNDRSEADAVARAISASIWLDISRSGERWVWASGESVFGEMVSMLEETHMPRKLISYTPAGVVQSLSTDRRRTFVIEWDSIRPPRTRPANKTKTARTEQERPVAVADSVR
jgi:hypothetical protein